MAPHGTTKPDVKRVMSHPQALAQCDEYIRREGFDRVVGYDTAGSAKLIADAPAEYEGTAAICSAHAAEIYGLEVLDQDIEDDNSNVTRFWLLSTHAVPVQPESNCKTCVVFAPLEREGGESGLLFKALSVFAIRDLNISKIESRPASRMILKDALRNYQANSRNSMKMERAFQFMFYLDVSSDVNNQDMTNALRHLSEIAPFIRVLGSYTIRNALPREPPQAGEWVEDTLVPTIKQSRLSIAIVGFGNFGQFLARRFIKAGQIVQATDFITDQSEAAAAMGVRYVHADPSALLNADVDVVIISVSVLSFVTVLSSMIPLELLKGKLVVDVLSVKTHPRDTMLATLHPECDVLCTHPMFGPESGKASWLGLPFMYEKVRVLDHHRASRFLTLFEDEGCHMVPMPCETCLLYTSDAADEEDSVDLGGRRVIKKKKDVNKCTQYKVE
eukprot:TRINITY_DN17055_c0_g1_i4.p1 TRINITY_DN17055_c0_g1~~TRINITY_DN17055_c0_g1_i4.p1  ORF type:complete len:445 (+),score=95.22 TRINITY_DN17055_c0_g1_i4:118-1452(+)